MTGEYYATTGLNHQTRIGSFHLPELHAGRQRLALGHGHRRHEPDRRARPSRSAAARRRRTPSGQYSFTVPAGTYPTETAAKPGFDPASASTIAVPDGGSATKNFTLSASAQSGCFTDNTQSTFQRGVPANCDLVTNPGSVAACEPRQHDGAERPTSVRPASASTTRAGQGRRSRRPLPASSGVSTSSSSARLQRDEPEHHGLDPRDHGRDPGANRRRPRDRDARGLQRRRRRRPQGVTFASPADADRGHSLCLRLPPATAARTGTYAYTCSCVTQASPTRIRTRAASS